MIPREEREMDEAQGAVLLALCEARTLCLNPDTLYMFEVVSGYDACEQAAKMAMIPSTTGEA